MLVISNVSFVNYQRDGWWVENQGQCLFLSTNIVVFISASLPILEYGRQQVIFTQTTFFISYTLKVCVSLKTYVRNC